MQTLNASLVVLADNGQVVNNAFNYTKNMTYFIYNTSITNLSVSFWDQIKDPKNFQKPFSIKDVHGTKLMTTIDYINTTNKTVSIKK